MSEHVMGSLVCSGPTWPAGKDVTVYEALAECVNCKRTFLVRDTIPESAYRLVPKESLSEFDEAMVDYCVAAVMEEFRKECV